jgi:hypothetical protein
MNLSLLVQVFVELITEFLLHALRIYRTGISLTKPFNAKEEGLKLLYNCAATVLISIFER